MSPKVLIFCGPSGSGKGTIVKHLLSTRSDLAFSISATTRKPRQGEENGTHYYFLSLHEFQRKIQEQQFVEYEEVYEGVFYGTLKSEMERIWANQKHVLFDVEVRGAMNLRKYFGEKALSVFVKPPSLEILEERLRGRGDGESEAKVQERLAVARTELNYASQFDQILINDDLAETFRSVEEIVAGFLDKPKGFHFL